MVSVTTEAEVIKVLLELGDFICGLDGSHAEIFIVLPEPDTLGRLAGSWAGRKTL